MTTLLTSLTKAPSDAAFPLHLPGRYHDLNNHVASNTAAAMTLTASREYASLMWIPRAAAYDRIGVFVTTGVASSHARLGVRQMGADGLPGALILDAGDVGTVSSSAVAEATITLTLPRGWCYLVVTSDSAIAINGYAVFAAPLGASSPGGGARAGVSLDRAYGALPATYTGSIAYPSPIPRVALRAA